MKRETRHLPLEQSTNPTNASHPVRRGERGGRSPEPKGDVPQGGRGRWCGEGGQTSPPTPPIHPPRSAHPYLLVSGRYTRKQKRTQFSHKPKVASPLFHFYLQCYPAPLPPPRARSGHRPMSKLSRSQRAPPPPPPINYPRQCAERGCFIA